MEFHSFWIWGTVYPSRLREDKCLVYWYASEYLLCNLIVATSWDWHGAVKKIHIFLFDKMADIFMSRELIFFMWSALISSIYLSILVSIFNLAASIFPTNLLLTLRLSIRSSKDVIVVEISLSCSISFDENKSISDLRFTSSFPTFFNNSFSFWILY